MRITPPRTRRSPVALVAVAISAVTLGACQDDDAPADPPTAELDRDTDDADAPGGAGDATGPTSTEAVPPAESTVTVEALDAPTSAAEIRVGEIIVEFDGEVTAAGTVLTLEEPILFDFDTAELKSSADDALDAIAEVIAFYEDVPVEVIGHTDDVGSADYNRSLSSERAQAVRDALVLRGIPDPQLTATGRGFDDPVASNDAEDGRAANRRVEVVLEGVAPPE